jgi:hypothetical protein
MSEAMKWIVAGFVKVGSRQALNDLNAHHCRMATELKSRRGGVFDLSSPIRQLEDEIKVIEEGLAKLGTRVAA